MWEKRAKDFAAAFIVGNGVLDLLAPRQRYLLWVFGPEGVRKLTLGSSITLTTYAGGV